MEVPYRSNCAQHGAHGPSKGQAHTGPFHRLGAEIRSQSRVRREMSFARVGI